MGYCNRKAQFQLQVEVAPSRWQGVNNFQTEAGAIERKEEYERDGCPVLGLDAGATYRVQPIARWE